MKQLNQHMKILGQLIVILFLGAPYARAQNNGAIEQSLAAYQQNNFVEKLYVHTDKSFYVTGELLWFKAYVVNSANKPLDISKVAYVDVLDGSNNAVMQGKIGLSSGSGNGSFYIPLSLPNGTYRLRAYTNWMKNYGPDFYFEKIITIVNPLKSPAEAQAKNTPAYDIQFFPEGGYLVNGLPGKVAFKLTATDGRGADFKGALINQHNDTVLRFSPFKFGMGSFVFTPATGNTYRAVIRVPGQPVQYTAMPEVKTQGYTLRLTDAGSQLQLSVAGNVNSGSTLYCLTHTRQTLTDLQRITVTESGTQIILDKDKLAEGINYITLLNSNRQPVAERLYFKRPAAARQMGLNLTVQQQTYGVRKPVNVAISAVAASQPVQADLSVSVYRLDSLQKNDSQNIYNSLWLGTGLKGYIEAPEYYFERPDRQTDEALDNLMLTQGWRRFNWDKIFHPGASPAYLPEYAGHIISGRMLSTVTGKPAPGILGYVAIPAKRAELYAARSDSAGNLLFETKDFYGSRELIMQTNIRQDSTYRIEVQSPFSEQYATDSALPGLNLPGTLAHDLNEYNLSMQVQNVYAGPSLRHYYNPGIDSASFYDRPAKTYLLDDFTRFTTIEEVLREYVTGISVTNRQRHFHIRTIEETATQPILLEDEPLILLDGVPLFNVDRAFAMDPLKIKKLETISRRYYEGPALYDGILSFTTYKGDLGGMEIDPHAVVVDYEGLQLQREFYSPVYGTSQQSASRLPDFRNVLYWEPNAGTNPQGKNTLQFYTSDLPGRYLISVQGITRNGEAGSRQVVIEVKK